MSNRTRSLRATLFAAALLTAPLPIATSAMAAPQTFDLDPAHTTIAFWVDHIGYARTLGWFTEVTGSFVYDAEARTVSDIVITVSAASVFSNDDARDGHVRNADFLDVEQYPDIVFTAAGGEETGENTGVIPGQLTLLGETRPLDVSVTLNKDAAYPFGHQKRTLGLSAQTTITRSEFGMDYALGGLVGDDVTVIIETEAIARD